MQFISYQEKICLNIDRGNSKAHPKLGYGYSTKCEHDLLMMETRNDNHFRIPVIFTAPSNESLIQCSICNPYLTSALLNGAKKGSLEVYSFFTIFKRNSLTPPSFRNERDKKVTLSGCLFWAPALDLFFLTTCKLSLVLISLLRYLATTFTNLSIMFLNCYC